MKNNLEMTMTSTAIRVHSLLPLIAILAVAFGIRAWNLSYNTAFLDEAIYVIAGHRLLNGAPIQSYGWLSSYPLAYPIFANLVDRLGGLLAVRTINIFFNLGTTLAIYALTVRLFSKAIGFLAAAVYAFSASPILVSRMATHDAMSVFLLSITIFLLIKGLQDERPNLLRLSALTGFCSFLTKYVGGFYLPFISLALSFHQRRRWVWRDFVIPLAFLGAGYMALYLSTLVLPFLIGEVIPKRGAQEAPNVRIAWFTMTFLGPAMIPALLAIVKRPKERHISFLLLGGALLILIYHLANQTHVALYKHAAYGLIFLAPIAGLGIPALFSGLGQSTGREGNWMGAIANTGRVVVAVGLMVALWLWSWLGIPILEGFWPNAERSVSYLSQRLKGHEVILAESVWVYQYYLQLHGPRLEGLRIVERFGGFTYQGQRGDQAILRAIDDGYFDFVVLDGTLTGRHSPKIVSRLEGGYWLVFTDPPEATPEVGIISIFERAGTQPAK